MAKTEVYTCDICKQSKSRDDLAKITVRTEGIHIKNHVNYSGLQIDVCPDCLRKKGFVVEAKTKEEIEQAKKQNEVSLEDKIYDFLSDMGVVFTE
ncbi:hypothetical protein V8Q34_14885 [Blautia sp. JLR.GB0024]|uniref:hypothetical protein n=1 Tax=Blautia sp. JLR.GB0024 TaxID=3123295 RepID=UPI003003E862